jgi:DNA-binding NarL/FixJ family response regulator
MPKLTGIDVTRWIRARHPEVGVLVLTAYDDTPYVLAVLQAGANGYVLKTAAPAEMIAAVRDVYAGKSALDATIARKVLDQFSAVPAQPDARDLLSSREQEVLLLVARGFTNSHRRNWASAIARQGHLAHIFDKLAVASRTEAVMRAVALGLVPPDLSVQ